MDGEQPVVAKIPITKKHYEGMAHKVNTEKLRDMLREKCRIRVRELRHNKFDVSRQLLENEKQWLTDVLKGELTELEMDVLLEEEILNEIINEQYQWMCEQFERSFDVTLANDPMSLLVLCPICQIAELKYNNHLLSCSCGYKQVYNGSLEGFWKTVQKNLAEHEEKCASKLTVFMDSIEMALNFVCNHCDFIAIIK